MKNRHKINRITDKLSVSQIHHRYKALSPPLTSVPKLSSDPRDSFHVTTKLVKDDLVGLVGHMIDEHRRHHQLAPHRVSDVISTCQGTVL